MKALKIKRFHKVFKVFLIFFDFLAGQSREMSYNIEVAFFN